TRAGRRGWSPGRRARTALRDRRAGPVQPRRRDPHSVLGYRRTFSASGVGGSARRHCHGGGPGLELPALLAHVGEELDRLDAVLIGDVGDLLVLVQRVRTLAVLLGDDRRLLGLGVSDDEGVGFVALPLDPLG